MEAEKDNFRAALGGNRNGAGPSGPPRGVIF